MKEKRIFCIGDIHNNYKGFKQALERCKFDYENDTLISLGDLVDGHSQAYEVIEELLKIKNKVLVKGNHDDWFYTWLKTGNNPSNWQQGQKATGLSYLNTLKPGQPWLTYIEGEWGGMDLVENLKPEDIPESHLNIFKSQVPYYIDENNNLFIHGGFDRNYKLEEQDEFNFWWDRDLWQQALSFEATKKEKYIPNYEPSFNMVEDFNNIFIGHTSTQFWKCNEPMQAANITNLDTGGGMYGYVSIMDVNTKEYWQSDNGKILYPEFKGRS